MESAMFGLIFTKNRDTIDAGANNDVSQAKLRTLDAVYAVVELDGVLPRCKRPVSRRGWIPKEELVGKHPAGGNETATENGPEHRESGATRNRLAD